MKKWLGIGFIVLITTVVLTGCNTLSGAGKDIQQGGAAIEDAAG